MFSSTFQWCRGAASCEGAVKELTTFFIATGHPIHILLPAGVACLKGRLHYITGEHGLIRGPATGLQLPFPGRKAPWFNVESLPVKASGAIST